MKFVEENQDLFIAAASILNTMGADIEMEVDDTYWKEHKEIKYTNVPVLRGYMGPEGEGFYFRARRKQFGIDAEDLLDNFPINVDGYAFEAVDFSDLEYDDDRYWPESVSFIVTKDGINVLKIS